MDKDPLFFLSDPTGNITINQVLSSSEEIFNISPIQFFINLIIVIALIYVTILTIRFFMGSKPTKRSYLLHEITLTSSMSLLFIRVSKKLYIVLCKDSNLTLIDTISSQKEILSILTETEDETIDKTPSWFKFFKSKKTSITSDTFEKTLKTIINNSNDLEELKNK